MTAQRARSEGGPGSGRNPDDHQPLTLEDEPHAERDQPEQPEYYRLPSAGQPAPGYPPQPADAPASGAGSPVSVSMAA